MRPGEPAPSGRASRWTRRYNPFIELLTSDRTCWPRAATICRSCNAREPAPSSSIERSRIRSLKDRWPSFDALSNRRRSASSRLFSGAVNVLNSTCRGLPSSTACAFLSAAMRSGDAGWLLTTRSRNFLRVASRPCSSRWILKMSASRSTIPGRPRELEADSRAAVHSLFGCRWLYLS